MNRADIGRLLDSDPVQQLLFATAPAPRQAALGPCLGPPGPDVEQDGVHVWSHVDVADHGPGGGWGLEADSLISSVTQRDAEWGDAPQAELQVES